jgi:hypothetical protein
MFTAQLCCQGACTQAGIIRVFGVSKNSLLRSIAKYRQEGIDGFYRPRRGRGASVITDEVAVQAEKLLALRHSRNEVAEQLGVKRDTLRKAIKQGRVQQPTAVAAEEVSSPPSASPAPVAASDKSTRSDTDAAAGDEMGIACTRPCERVLAALGRLPGGAPTKFQPCRDVSFGGVLCFTGLGSQWPVSPFGELAGALRLLHEVPRDFVVGLHGLVPHQDRRTTQYEQPGELGKLMGLDRIPEVRCLRNKVSQLSQDEGPQRWAGTLSQEWMEQNSELAGTLYVDGHVRLYHGRLTKLPKRYVTRQRLCLRGTTDYWVNDALGQPFFVIERSLDHGMLEALRSDIVPRLLKDVPGQPTDEQLQADPHLSRLVIIFDREGYSPSFFRQMWQDHRIACITYHKYPKKVWPESWFTETEVTMPNGEVVSMKDEMTAPVRPMLRMLAAAGALLLLIACANLVTLFLERSDSRRAELSVRRALGASAGDVLWLVARSALRVIGAGAAIGLALSTILGQVLATLPRQMDSYYKAANRGELHMRVDLSRLERGMRRVERATSRLAGGIMATGLFIGGVLLQINGFATETRWVWAAAALAALWTIWPRRER